jgi:transposase
MADFEKKTQRDPTFLTNEEWRRIAPRAPKPAKKGRRPSLNMRKRPDAIRDAARAGCGWRTLSKGFPPGRRCADAFAV